MADRARRRDGLRSRYAVMLVILLLAGLPVAAWLDLRDLNERILRDQARDLSSIIDDIRAFYATDVVMQAHGEVIATNNYRDIPGAIPIPATLSLELGHLISQQGGAVQYAHVRDLMQVRPLPPMAGKGVSREVSPYAVVGLLGKLSRGRIINESASKLHLFLDVDNLDEAEAARVRTLFEEALAALKERPA